MVVKKNTDIILNLWDNITLCLSYLIFKLLNFRVCGSNLTMEVLHILNFIKTLAQIILWSMSACKLGVVCSCK
jgi:hypothetical protein